MLRSSFLWDPPALTFRVGRRGSGCRQRVRGWVTVLQGCPNEARRGEARRGWQRRLIVLVKAGSMQR